jgi:hypothetical protein
MADADFMLPNPTIECVRAECDAFDREPSTRLAEDALRQLRECFPRNVDPAQVIVKVIALNRLYSARVLDKDIEMVALAIAEQRIDPLLDEGSPKAIELIIGCCTGRRYYSFATKFCSWHNPNTYVIYDGNVNECLWRYEKRDKFSRFRRGDLYDYEKLAGVIGAFKEHYELQSFTSKEIDKFLWRVGDRLLNPSASEK